MSSYVYLSKSVLFHSMCLSWTAVRWRFTHTVNWLAVSYMCVCVCVCMCAGVCKYLCVVSHDLAQWHGARLSSP